jgi:hypothetical protein
MQLDTTGFSSEAVSKEMQDESNERLLATGLVVSTLNESSVTMTANSNPNV